MAPKWLITVVEVCVVAVWTFSVVAGYLQKDYSALTVTTPVMLALAGYVFGFGIVKHPRGGNKDEIR